MLAFMSLAMLTGCGGTKEEEGSIDSLDPAKYVTLGEYKGLVIEGTDTTVSDGDVEKNIQDTLDSHGGLKEVTGRAAQMGDTVNIDYVGTRDGVAFDGGTGNYDLELGSGSFIDGFEEGVVGMNVGDEKDLPLTFPEDYHSEELAGANVVFHVTVNSISEPTSPELTDEFVQGLDNEAQTVDEYRELVRKQLTEQKEFSAKSDDQAELLQMAVDNAQCDESKLPKWLVDQKTEEYKTSTASFVNQYGVTLDDYLEQSGKDQDTFNAEAEEYGKTKAKNDLVILAIAKAEGLEVTDQEKEDYYVDYAASYNTNVEDMKKAIPEDELKMFMLQQKVMDLLYENAKIG